MNVLHLGLVDYETALKLQQSLVELRKQDRIADTLLLLEHPPVITLGRNYKPENLRASAEELAARGVQIFECNRGGDITFHGPGQLVGYPIFNLRAFTDEHGNRKTLGAVDFVRRMEEALIRTCGDLGIPTERIKGLTGVWTTVDSQQANSPRRRGGAEKNSADQQAKIAAIGVHISRAVTSHGFALNVSNDLDYFNLIIPCGIPDKPVTSIEKEIREKRALREGEIPTMQEVAHAIARNFGRVFKKQTLWLESLEDLFASANPPLPANQDTPARPPRELEELHEDRTFLA
ncbi:MAG TPA: lipoyl(octanoyl) transferase LipB [Terriglobales bacterium]|jgi:lipoyl(octanoyl) transferase|nr:lipoyl(octanoyl) transferase LipB [Terriglobales bacterium]